MYTTEYRRDFFGQSSEVVHEGDRVVLGICDSAKNAGLRRRVSGDLVYKDGKKLAVDECMDWLFAWEKNDPKCYAQKQIKAELGYNVSDTNFFTLNVCDLFAVAKAC